MAITLIAGIFTGCKAATAAMPDYTSVTEQPGGLPEKGTVGDKYTGLDCPNAALEVDHAPSEVLIVSTKGEQFNKIEP